MATSTPYATTNQVRNPGIYRFTVTALAADLGNADILTAWVPGHNFRIISTEVVCCKATTGAGGTLTITPKIGSVACTGGVCVPTLAATTAVGKYVAGTATTALNTGTTTDTVTLTGSASTAFTAGSLAISVVIQNTDNT